MKEIKINDVNYENCVKIISKWVDEENWEAILKALSVLDYEEDIRSEKI